MDEIINHLRGSRRILLATHVNPDGDAIGSLLAMGHALERLDKRVTLYNESPIPAVYRFLPSVRTVVRRIDAPEIYDTAVILDCGSLSRIGAAADAAKQIPVIINIDHHITNTGFGTYRIIDTGACATSEILWRLIRSMKVPVDKEIAAALYTGILTDTGSFRFSNTNREAFAICEALVGCGVEPYKVAKHVYGTYSLGRIKLLNLALDSIEISPNGKLSMMVLTREMMKKTGTRPEDVDGLINYARSIEEVKIAALIQENGLGEKTGSGGSRFHVSLRSDGSVDVARVAADFGGGGHYSAAGFSIDVPLSEIKSRLIGLANAL
jgi:phosphoesterase RecJ-like protein